MTSKIRMVDDDLVDENVEQEIRECFTEGNLKSFFSFAGAGSGKTRSLVNTLHYVEGIFGREFIDQSKKIAVITYTNAACDEIRSRVDYNPLFDVLTIHSFLWGLIKYYQSDIKTWLLSELEHSIDELEKKERESRKSSANRLRDIDRKKRRLKNVKQVFSFNYNPNGDNSGKDSLNHSDVIKMGSGFIQSKKVMQEVLVAQYPILLIDESQDTKKELIDALLELYKNFKEQINIGMFGDMMQRIYNDGKDNLPTLIPPEWVKPIKIMNHRSSKRIVDLANSIRENVDNIKQQPRKDSQDGFVRLFVVDSSSKKIDVENEVCTRMKDITGDVEWENYSENKRLILEHHMAASRLGFSNFFNPLYSRPSLKDGVLEGTLPEIRLFTDIVIPIVNAHNQDDSFSLTNIAKKYSSLVGADILKKNTINQITNFTKLKKSIDEIVDLANRPNSTVLMIVEKIIETKAFEVPVILRELVSFDGEDNISNEDIKARYMSFSCRFNEIKNYAQYISEETPFATHQGVKGLEFPRVLVIMDDEEAKGFLFSYEKLFGAKELSKKDISNGEKGRDTSVKRTTRLFYVACTRAEKSLAIIAYTKNKVKIAQTAVDAGWFAEEEIIFF